MRTLPPYVAALASSQSGVVSRRQLLESGGHDGEIRQWRRHRLLTGLLPGVYVDHTGAPTWQQRAWAAVLCTTPSALHGVSVLRASNPTSRADTELDPIHVAVDAARMVSAPSGVIVRRTRGFVDRAQLHLSPPRIRLEDAALDAAAEAPDDAGAVAVLAEVVSSRRTTAGRLTITLTRRTRIARRDLLTDVLADLAVGACSVLERAYLRDVERAHALPTARRQVRASSRGTVYRDVVYGDLGVVVELDGRADHTDPASRDRDLDRDLDARIDALVTVRLGAGQVLGRPCRTAARVARLLQRHGWDRARPGAAHVVHDRDRERAGSSRCARQDRAHSRRSHRHWVTR